jgi:hypothetical protein
MRNAELTLVFIDPAPSTADNHVGNKNDCSSQAPPDSTHERGTRPASASVFLQEAQVNSSVIGKIEKAKLYAQERERIRFASLSVRFHGDNGDHSVELTGDHWHCTCDFFAGYGACAHTMALERILEGMLPEGVMSTPLQKA